MAINTEFIDLIVPIETIRRKYPGGWEQCLQDHAPLLGGRVWHDDYLLRDGAMNPMDMQRLVEEWEAMGFTATAEVNGQKQWVDSVLLDLLSEFHIRNREVVPALECNTDLLEAFAVPTFAIINRMYQLMHQQRNHIHRFVDDR